MRAESLHDVVTRLENEKQRLVRLTTSYSISIVILKPFFEWYCCGSSKCLKFNDMNLFRDTGVTYFLWLSFLHCTEEKYARRLFNRSVQCFSHCS